MRKVVNGHFSAECRIRRLYVQWSATSSFLIFSLFNRLERKRFSTIIIISKKPTSTCSANLLQGTVIFRKAQLESKETHFKT